MQTVEQIIEQLLRVVLLIANEGFLEISERALQREGAENVVAFKPHVFDELGVLAGEGPLGAHFVVLVDLLLVVPDQKVVGKLVVVGEALQGGVHVAGVAQVLQADGAPLRVLVEGELLGFLLVFLLVRLRVGRAFVAVRVFVLLPAAVRAVDHLLARAFEAQLAAVAAELAAQLVLRLDVPLFARL